jgi:hypothetical protein
MLAEAADRIEDCGRFKIKRNCGKDRQRKDNRRDGHKTCCIEQDRRPHPPLQVAWLAYYSMVPRVLVLQTAIIGRPSLDLAVDLKTDGRVEHGVVLLTFA